MKLVDLILRSGWWLFVGPGDRSGKWQVSLESVVGAIRAGLWVFVATAATAVAEQALGWIDAIDFGVADSAIAAGVVALGEFIRRWRKDNTLTGYDQWPSGPWPPMGGDEWPPKFPSDGPINFSDAKE